MQGATTVVKKPKIPAKNKARKKTSPKRNRKGAVSIALALYLFVLGRNSFSKITNIVWPKFSPIRNLYSQYEPAALLNECNYTVKLGCPKGLTGVRERIGGRSWPGAN